MRPLSTFATEDKPLHPSQLKTLMECLWSAALMHLVDETGEGGPAAHTGSAMHAAAQSFHKGKDLAASLESMGSRIADYPLADLSDAASMFLSYAQDPRNRDAKIVLCEEPIKFQIAAAEEDPTQAPIQVIGTLDQVREVDGRLKLYDIKTSKKDPSVLLHLYTYQIAAYCVGASVLLGKRVDPGPIILPRRYTKNLAASPVFYHFPWTFDDVPQIMEGVRHAVALVRAGKLWHHPNADCQWCPMRTPDLCLPKLQAYKKSLGNVS